MTVSASRQSSPFAWCAIRRLRLAYPWRDHAAMALQGALLFGLNYVCVYRAEGLIPSGLVAVTFSMLAFLNIFGARAFCGTPLNAATLAGAAIGVTGVVLVFLPELIQGPARGHQALGFGYALVGVVSASFGNLLSARNQRKGLPVVQLNTFGMMYGAPSRGVSRPGCRPAICIQHLGGLCPVAGISFPVRLGGGLWRLSDPYPAGSAPSARGPCQRGYPDRRSAHVDLLRGPALACSDRIRHPSLRGRKFPGSAQAFSRPGG